jgi:hypothetical protein
MSPQMRRHDHYFATRESAFRRREFINHNWLQDPVVTSEGFQAKAILVHSKANDQTALFPGLTHFRHTSPSHRHNQQQRSWPSERTTNDRHHYNAQSWRIPKWLVASGLAISK